MKRHYFIADDLDDLTRAHGDLLENGLEPEQVRVLSFADSDTERRQLPDVQSLMKRDLVRSTTFGAVVGVLAAGTTLAVVYFTGIGARTSWVPFLFLAVVLLGFCTWEGAFLGIQLPNSRFRRFEEALSAGKHVLFVDVGGTEERTVSRITDMHHGIHPAGTGPASPGWLLRWQRGLKRFVQWAP